MVAFIPVVLSQMSGIEWRNGLDQDYRKKVLAAAGKHTYTLIEIGDSCKTHVHIGAVANEY